MPVFLLSFPFLPSPPLSNKDKEEAMRSTILAWAVILTIQFLLVSFFFKPVVKEALSLIVATVMAIQGYQVFVHLSPKWLRFLK